MGTFTFDELVAAVHAGRYRPDQTPDEMTADYTCLPGEVPRDHHGHPDDLLLAAAALHAAKSPQPEILDRCPQPTAACEQVADRLADGRIQLTQNPSGAWTATGQTPLTPWGYPSASAIAGGALELYRRASEDLYYRGNHPAERVDPKDPSAYLRAPGTPRRVRPLKLPRSAADS